MDSQIDLAKKGILAIEAQARPAVASEGLRAALERLVAAVGEYPSIIADPIALGEAKQARAALASAGSVGALDVERQGES